MYFNKITSILFSSLLVLLFSGCSSDKKEDSKATEVNVVVSTYALYDISKNILKDKVELKTVLPFGSDAHSYELSPKKVASIQDADLFVYSGASLEPWISRFSTSKSLDMSKYVKLIHLSDHDHHHDHKHEHEEHDAHHEHSHDADKMAVDPHYWLDIENMKTMTEVLAAEFIKLSPKNKEFFESNKKSYLKKLDEMKSSYDQSFKECKKDTIVVNHNAFSYLGKRYGFEIEAVSGLSNDSMPSPKDIKHVMHLIEEKNISVIFFESFASDKIIKSIANDTGVKVDTLHPLGNITKDQQGMSYKQIMDQNIEKIKQALECR